MTKLVPAVVFGFGILFLIALNREAAMIGASGKSGFAPGIRVTFKEGVSEADARAIVEGTSPGCKLETFNSQLRYGDVAVPVGEEANVCQLLRATGFVDRADRRVYMQMK